jgi:uncharacterized damage-inducible protein DinB
MDVFISNLFEKLNGLHEEILRTIHGLPSEALDWTPGEGINSMAVLVTHISGAERYWIGDVVGGDPSGRDRSAEFEIKNQDEEMLLRRLNDSLQRSRKVLEKLSHENLDELRISPRDGRKVTAGWALVHTLEHTALHTGHIQLMRQLWEYRVGK